MDPAAGALSPSLAGISTDECDGVRSATGPEDTAASFLIVDSVLTDGTGAAAWLPIEVRGGAVISGYPVCGCHCTNGGTVDTDVTAPDDEAGRLLTLLSLKDSSAEPLEPNKRFRIRFIKPDKC